MESSILLAYFIPDILIEAAWGRDDDMWLLPQKPVLFLFRQASDDLSDLHVSLREVLDDHLKVLQDLVRQLSGWGDYQRHAALDLFALIHHMVDFG